MLFLLILLFYLFCLLILISLSLIYELFIITIYLQYILSGGVVPRVSVVARWRVVGRLQAGVSRRQGWTTTIPTPKNMTWHGGWENGHICLISVTLCNIITSIKTTNIKIYGKDNSLLAVHDYSKINVNDFCTKYVQDSCTRFKYTTCL